MFDATTFARDMLTNPTKLALKTIQILESSNSDNFVITDINNGFVAQLGASVGVWAALARNIDYNYAFAYPRRAMYPDQLYPHLSQYDYVQLQATPASLNFLFKMEKVWIQNNAVPYDDNYNVLDIARTTWISVGNIKFGLHYPIRIYVNKNTGVISAVYDTSVTSPLETLSSNVLLSQPQEYTQDGITYVGLGFKMYQFERQTDTLTVSNAEGFDKTIPYTDQFYAVRVFSVAADGTATELEYSLDSMYYNTSTPTAVLSIDNVANTLRIQIPQIYFVNKQVGNRIRYELLTTKGALNYNIPLSDAASPTANFDTTSSIYAAPFAKMSIYSLYALNTTVVGGSDALTFAQMKDAVVNQKLWDRIPITPGELQENAAKNGYNLSTLVDDLTDRIHIATNTLLDSKNQIIPVLFGSILLDGDALSGNPDTIIRHSDETYTILPTTIFKLQGNGTLTRPLSNADIAYLGSLSVTDMLIQLNTGNYLRQPFHITLDTTNNTPAARIYNLLSPTLESLVFVGENIHSAAQMSIVQIAARHLDDGTSGFVIRFAVTMTAALAAIDPTYLRLALIATSKSDTRYYLDATYIQTTQSGAVFEVRLGTTYEIDAGGNITVLMMNSAGELSYCQLNLTAVFDIRMMVAASQFPTIQQDSNLTGTIPFDITNYLVLSRQTATITLGTDMSNQLYTAVNTSWGNDVYKTYGTTIYQTTDTAIYQRDESGLLVRRVTPNAGGTSRVELVMLYDIGDTPSAEGNISTTLSSDTLENNPVIHITDATGLLVGMPVIQAGIAYGTRIEHISGTAITLSAAPTAVIVEGSTIAFANAKILTRTTTTQRAVGNTLTVATTSGCYVGMSVFGFDIPKGTTITDIPDGTTLVLSQNTTAAVGTNVLVTLLNTTAAGVILHEPNDRVVDATGAPIVVKDRQNQYRIPAILFDGRLYESTDPTDQETIANLPQRLVDYAAGISNINIEFAEQQQIFYRPSRTIGTASFGVGDGVTEDMNLAMGLSILVSVPKSVYVTSDMRTSIENTILTICATQIQSTIISTTTIGKEIADTLGSTIDGVSVSGINNDPSKVIIALRDTDAVPSIEGILTEQTDGSLTRVPNITITFISSPDES